MNEKFGIPGIEIYLGFGAWDLGFRMIIGKPVQKSARDEQLALKKE